MKRWNSLISLLLCAALLFSLAACQTEEAEPEQNPTGRYVEASMGEPSSGSFPHTVRIVDGTLLALTTNGLYESKFGGAAWGPAKLTSPTLSAAADDWNISQGLIREDGGVLLVLNVWDEETRQHTLRYDYCMVEPDGTERMIPIQLPDENPPSEEELLAGTGTVPNVQEMVWGPDNTVLIRDLNDVISQFDLETGELLHSLSSGDHYNTFAVVGNTLAVLPALKGVELYDLSTWERLDSDSTLNQFITGKDEHGDPVPVSTEDGPLTIGTGNVRFFTSDEENMLYICGQTGVFRHLLGGAVIEQIVSGDLCSLGNPACQVSSMVKSEDDVFYAACMSTGQGPGVLSYTYDPDIPFMPEILLKVYSLYEDPGLRQTAADFQQSRDDIYIQYQVGCAYGTGMTASDAVRILNANIMAGKGPDILVLDGLPRKAYEEKGLLMELSELKSEIEAENELMDNIVTAFAHEDGSLYAMPTFFTVPLLYAPKDMLDSITDLRSLTDTIVRLREENPDIKGITGQSIPYAYFTRMAIPSFPAWFKEDGSLDRDALKEFLELLKTGYDAEIKGHPPVVDEQHLAFLGGHFMAVDVHEGNALIATEGIDAASGFGCLITLDKDLEGYGYKPLPGQSGKVFQTAGSIGINAATEYPEEAKALYKTFFEQRAQSSSWEGLPVRTENLRHSLENTGSTGLGLNDGDGNPVFSIEKFDSATVEQVQEMLDLIASLDTPYDAGASEVENAISKNACDYLDGKIDLQTALEQITSQVDLNLAEGA